jgi:beta-lactamase regulating signal transducer with metallopeptidase domain
MNWLHYLVEANIYLGVFYLCYCLFLNNETHYTLSRIYLLFSCVISFILPVTQLSILKPIQPVVSKSVAFVPANIAMHYPIPPPPPPVAPAFTLQDGLIYVYILGAAIALAIFLFRLYQLFKLSRNSKTLNDDNYRIIHLKRHNTAFSFFNYLFIGTNISQSETIIAHELVHIRQKHSWDIMLLEVLKVINWFNPFVYLLQRSIKTVHEYIADEQTAAYERDALTYSSFLLNNAYGIQGSTIAHSFFNYNLLKKRIIMLNKNRSGKLARLKYLTVLPLCAGMLCASTLAFAKDYGWVDLMPRKTLKTAAVIDTIKHKLPPPPAPPTMKPSKVKMPPPAPPTMKQGKVKLPPPPIMVKPDKVTSANKLLPPPPHDPVYTDLMKYAAKSVRYPTAAFNKRITGNVLVSLRLDDAHKITDLKVINGIGSGCDEEVIRALKSYPGTISQKPGMYRLMVSFALTGEKGEKSYYPKPVTGKIAGSKDFIGQVIVEGYVTDETKQVQ